MSAWISILGLYEYDPTIFDGLILPTAADITTDAEKVANPWVPDKQDFVNYICMELAEVGLVYGSAPVMASMIAVWSKVHIHEWIELYNTLLYKYNPIWNVDGIEKETRDLDGKNERTADLDTTDTRTYTNLTDDHSYTNLKDTQTGSIEHDITGYDANTYSPNTRDNYNQVANERTGSEKFTRNGEDKNVQNIDGTDKWYTEDNGTITKERSGNIGVTMTQAMIREQREIVQFNLYEYMLQSFKKQFCVMVY